MCNRRIHAPLPAFNSRCSQCGKPYWRAERREGDRTVLQVGPLLAMACGREDFEDLLDREFTGPDLPRQVIVDLSRLPAISSSFVGMLVKLKKRLQSAGVEMVMCGLQPAVHEVFVYTRLDRFFEIFENEADASEARC